MIEQKVRQRLLQNEEISLLIGDSVFLDQGNKSKTLFIRLTVLRDVTPVDVQLDKSQSYADIQIDCVGKSPLSCKELAVKVDDHINLKGFSLSPINCQIAIKETQIPSFDEETKLYKESLDYRFNYHKVE